MSTTNGSKAPFPAPTLPQGKAQWHHELNLMEYAVLGAASNFMTARYALTDTEFHAVIKATAPIAAQMRREAFKVLRQHRR